MRPLRGLLIASALLFGLASCSTMSEKECQFANWRDIGLTDGLAGKSLGLLDARRSDCAEARIQVDQDAYLKGRKQGLQTYCQLATRYRLVCAAKPTKASARLRSTRNSAVATRSGATSINFMPKSPVSSAAWRRWNNNPGDSNSNLNGGSTPTTGTKTICGSTANSRTNKSGFVTSRRKRCATCTGMKNSCTTPKRSCASYGECPVPDRARVK